jgi:hypothetical protein
VPWDEDLVARSSSTPRAIDATRLPIDAGASVSKAYRLRIVAQRIEGSGPLRIAIPLPDKKRVELDAHLDDTEEICVVLSVRESLISGDLGLKRPLPAPFQEEKAPGKIEALGRSRQGLS